MKIRSGRGEIPSVQQEVMTKGGVSRVLVGEVELLTKGHSGVEQPREVVLQVKWRGLDYQTLSASAKERRREEKE